MGNASLGRHAIARGTAERANDECPPALSRQGALPLNLARGGRTLVGMVLRSPWQFRRRWVVAVLGLAMTVGCDDNLVLVHETDDGGAKDSTTVNDGSAAGSALIGPGGGTVTLGGASLSIPAGALEDPTVIRISIRGGSPPSEYETFSSFYEFAPSGLTFLVPATVVLPEHDPSASSSIYWSSGDSDGYTRLTTTEASGLASANVTHFSDGFVGEVKASSEGGVPGASDAGAPDTAPPDSADAFGTVTVLATKQDLPSGIAVNGTTVYWTAAGKAEAIVSVPISGGTPTTLVSGLATPAGIALDNANVYWTNSSSLGSLMSVPLTGGSATTLVDHQNAPGGLAIDATNLYWVTTGDGTVMTAPLSGIPDGGPATTLASGQDEPYAIAIDKTHVYWSNIGPSGTIMSLPLTGGSPTTLATGQSSPFALTVDASNVYWGATGSSTIARVPLGGGVVTTIATGQGAAFGIVVSDATLYWTTELSTVVSTPVAGGPLTIVASMQDNPRALTLDKKNVYWTNFATDLDGGGSIARTAR
jgi:sugar lactone lactonase YvrE